MNKKLVLFDIDGTLILCGKAPRRSITKAMQEVFGTAGAADGYSFSGKTDPQIVLDLMVQAGIPEATVRDRLQRAIRMYVEALRTTLRPEDIRVLAGVPELLDALSRLDQVVLGLLTGNVLEGARTKIEQAGLGGYFPNGDHGIGAFGSDSMRRDDLPAVAVRRARERTGHSFTGSDIVIVGDSPSDVGCGRPLGVKTIAVATGWHTADELAVHGPDHLFENLQDTAAVLQAILSA